MRNELQPFLDGCYVARFVEAEHPFDRTLIEFACYHINNEAKISFGFLGRTCIIKLHNAFTLWCFL